MDEICPASKFKVGEIKLKIILEILEFKRPIKYSYSISENIAPLAPPNINPLGKNLNAVALLVSLDQVKHSLK